VKKFDQESLFGFYQKHFTPGNLIVAAAGSLKHDDFVQRVAERFQELKPSPNGWQIIPPKSVSRIVTRNKKSLEQVQICLGVPAPHVAHEQRYVSYILNTLLGGGMSSRLFQKIREEQGLTYAIYSDLNPYRDTGCMCVYAGTSKENAPRVVEQIVQEFRHLKEEEIPEEELRRVKDQLKGNLMLSLESSTARMSNLARQEMYFDRFFELDEIIERVEEVTARELIEMSRQIFQQDSIAVTVLGNLNGVKISRAALAC